ncbi:MAG: amino acid adenylation domain-containing protein [Candidatus Aminicenantes bacterium]|jgi:amino acid adenylation domain-containing protein/thioester reductase-like protein
MRNSDYSSKLTIAAGQYVKERDYWLNQLSDFTGKSMFPYDNSVPGREIETLKFKLSPGLFSRTVSLSKGSDYRIHMIMVTGIVVLLHKYSYPCSEDITVGIPTYKQDVEGELINTVLAVRTQINPDMTFKELLLQVSQVIFQANEHQNYPIDTLLYKLNMQKSENDFPLFDIAILLDTIHDRNYLKDIHPNMVFIFSKTAEYMEGTLEYNALLYHKTTIERITDHLGNLLQNALNDMNCPLSGVEIVSEEERKRLLIDFNDNSADFSRDKTVCQLIEKHVERIPDKTALVGGNSKFQIPNSKQAHLTYRELDQKSNQLTRILQAKGVKPDTIVGILMNRSVEMVVSILAIWKASGAYIPIDPDYPKERIDFILKDSGAKTLWSEESQVSGVSSVHCNSPLERGAPQGRGVSKSATGLAYIIYTSGSTGKPKGAMVEYIGMMNHIAAKIVDLQLTGKSIIAQNATHTFDISVWQFFAPLTVGGKTVIYPDELIMEPERFLSQLVKDRVTILELVPSYLSLLLDILDEHYSHIVPLPLHYLLVTGEEIKPNLVRKWFDKFPGIKMVNAYGPTEASDDITHHIMHKVPDMDMERIPIGKPVQNFNIYVMSEHMQLCPVGVKGEIWVSGIGVGRGYLNNPELTAEKFVLAHSSWLIADRSAKQGDAPASGDSEEFPMSYELPAMSYFYQTGDLGRWLGDGTLEFFGRKDFQVKIRGFRIELGEIENRLLNHQGIKEGIVISKEDKNGNKYLCAYVVPHSSYSTGSLKEYLSKYLPDYMVPTHFVELKEMPLTPSGKIDRKALPEPDVTSQHDIPYITAAMLNQTKVPVETKESEDAKNTFEKNKSKKYTLSTEERERILYEFNANKSPYLKEKTVHQLFQEQAERTPNYIAVVGALSEGTRGLAPLPVTMSITYKELNHKSNQLAHLLREKGVKPDTIVGLRAENSIKMVIGVFGILKAGGAYLPIGCDYPDERIAYLLSDSNAKILVSEGSKVSRVNEVLELSPPLRNSPLERGVCEADGVCHITYTSGTTGRPKGIMAEHRHIHNAVLGLWQRVYKQYGENLKFALLIPFYFDGFIKQTFGALLYGHILYIVPEESRFNGKELLEFFQKYKIDISDGTPTHIRLLLESNKNINHLPAVKHFVIAGDVLPKHVVEKFFRLFADSGRPNPKITNLYGPTECCVDSTSYEVSSGNIGLWDKIPIGKSMPNEQVYIMDKDNNPVPVGAVGELCISGDCVTRGYLNQPELTSVRFINYKLQNTNYKQITKKGVPFGRILNAFGGGDAHELHELTRIGTTSNEKFLRGVQGGSFFKKRPPGRRRLYKTGDLARWLPDGNIEFIGRIDHQIQILGVRIEPGEIESVLLNHADIKEAVVVARERIEGERYPCAFVVSERDMNQSELREYLEGKLPDYMIPPVFVQLEKMPLTPLGKIDRKVLEAVEIPVHRLAEYEPPADQLEEKLVEIWSEVLNMASPGVTGNFFDLGGHSLKAVILLSKIHKAFNVRITLGELFQQPTIRGLAGYIRGAKEDKFSPIEPTEKREYYPLSSAQKRLYILQQMESSGIAYNLPQLVPLDSDINREELERTFKKLIKRHESLRTSLLMIDNEPVQKVDDKVDFAIEDYDLTTENTERTGGLAPLSKEPATRNPQLTKALISSFIRPFDLSRAPLLRVGLMELPHTPAAHCAHPRRGTYNSHDGREHKYIMMLDMHHIISDGFSHGILVEDFMSLYPGKTLSPLKLQYKDYSQWQNSEKQKENITLQEGYWLKEFSDKVAQVNLPLDYVRPAAQSFAGKILEFTIGETNTRNLKSRASHQDVTLYMELLAIFNVLLAKLSGTEEVVIGTAVAGRRHTNLEKIIGMFVNTLVLQNHPEGEKPFHVFLQEVKKKTLDAFENQDYPFEDLVEKISVKRDANRNPLFDIMFNYQSADRGSQPGSMPQFEKPLESAPELYESQISKFDLTLTAVDLDKNLYFAIEYCTKLFEEKTIKRFIDCFKRIVSFIVGDYRKKISEIEIISEDEKQQILYDFNDTASAYPRDKTIHRLFAEQVERTPDGNAVLAPLASLEGTRGLAPLTAFGAVTYKELNEKSNQLVRLLIEKGIQTDTPIAIMAGPSIEVIAGILAILKVGGAYMPIDPDYPKERIKYVLEDSGTNMLLITTGLSGKLEKLSIDNCQFLMVNEKSPARRRLNTPPEEANNNLQLKSASLAYILYTSGSTGRPKGVMVEHRNVGRLVKNTNYIEFKQGDRILQTGALEFDASTFEIWGSLLNGLTLYLLRKEQILSVETLKAAVTKFNITTLWMTAPWFNQVSTTKNEVFAGLKNLLVGGDVLSPYHINRVREKYPELNIINGYGPTENTTFSTSFQIDKVYNRQGETIPIGKPIANSTAYIVDLYNHLQPVNVPGQLWVGGDGVVRGYLNNPELTAEKFVLAHSSWLIADRSAKQGDASASGDSEEFPKSYELPAMSYFYKTGDLARWLAGGNIEFLGRIDQQVKIRGFRIELGEIESQLVKHPVVKEAVVLALENEPGDKYICAYIVPVGALERTLINKVLKNYLSHTLPDYMIPTCFLSIEKIPLTPNGKIHRHALPEPGLIPGETYAAPRSHVEQKLVEIWSEVLGKHNSIGINDDFFEIGGNSLKAVQVVSSLIKEFDITIDQIFQYPTILELAPRLIRKKDNLLNKIHQAKQHLEPGDSQNKLVKSLVQSLMKQHKAYKKRAKNEALPNLKEEKNYQRIFLTGGTGYLGIHLVFELLKRTSAALYLVVRGHNPEEAEHRFKRKCLYYFGEDFYETHRRRLNILVGDLRKDRLGIDWKQYEELSQHVEAVVHAAANVRHFGRYAGFYENNVKATENLLDFSLTGAKKDFHHISTMSVGASKIIGKKSNLFTEFCHDIRQQPDNIYVKSKLEAEKKVLAYKERGLNASIYRVGNLTAHSETGKFQENINDNAFYASLKAYLSMGMIPFGEESWADITFIDQTAEALVLLITRKGFFNETFHLQNITRLSLEKLAKFLRKKGIKIKLVTMGQFLDHLAGCIENKGNRLIIDRFLLHGGMFSNEKWETVNMLVSDRTQLILKKLGFEWKEVTEHHIAKMIHFCREVGFIK